MPMMPLAIDPRAGVIPLSANAAHAPEAGSATSRADASSDPTGMPTLLTRVTNFATQVMDAFRFEASNTARAGLIALTYTACFTAYRLGLDEGRREGHDAAVKDMTQQLLETFLRSGRNALFNTLTGVGNAGMLDMEGDTSVALIRTHPWDLLLCYPSDQPEEECGMESALVPTGTSYPWQQPF
jgi:hypothetical protein